MLPQIIPTAEPFFFRGGPTGCLLTHGFTGSPKEMHWMGEYLAAQGYTVLGVRLAGHATQVEDILHMCWQDWYASVLDGYHLLRQSTERVFAIGLSMGGALSLLLASQHPVSGVVVMSTPASMPPDPRLRYIRQLHYLIPRLEKDSSDFRNPEAARVHVDYPYYPTKAVAELNDLLGVLRQNVGKVTVPALLAYSHRDTQMIQDGEKFIYANIRSTDKEVIWLENSGHVITVEPEREIVFEAASRFIQRITQAEGIPA